MAEVMENTCHHDKYASNAKANAGLTTGIIGTSLAGILALKSGLFNGILGGIAPQPAAPEACNLPFGSLYNERKENQDYIELTKQYYEGQIANREDLNSKFFSLYKMGNDNTFAVYKQHVDDSFALYKGQRDTKDDLLAKINEVEKKVDVMSAVRPYQDALINAKIDNVALVGDFNLARRTCRMIQGELVLPSTPTVTGYASYSPCNPIAPASGA
jgi:hypothetical protein